MLKKLVRAVFTLAGAIVGYGVFSLARFFVALAGYEDLVDFSGVQELCIAALFAIIFGLIFFRLTPTIKRQGNKMANNIEVDLQKVSVNDLVMGTLGLIAGLIIAFLISQIYVGITIPYLDVILNIVTYIILGYLGIVIATTKGKDIRSAWTRSKLISSVGGGKSSRSKNEVTPKIFDHRREDSRYHEDGIHRRKYRDTRIRAGGAETYSRFVGCAEAKQGKERAGYLKQDTGRIRYRDIQYRS